MDLNNQTRPTQVGPQPMAQHPQSVGHRPNKKSKMTVAKTVSGILLIAVALLIAGLAALTFTSKNEKEESFVDKTKYQAVFLNGGQVYFGKIKSLNNRYLRISDIYYLQVNQQVQPDQDTDKPTDQNQNVSLVKLGCELHGPENEMLINREQIIFWENLKDDGQVAKAVAEYQKQNPDGQKCNTNATTPPPAATPPANP